MNKRKFLITAGTSGLSLAAGSAVADAFPQPAGSRTPVMLTISGNINRANRGPCNALTDQLLYKQGVRFDKAYALDLASLLTAVPAHTLRATVAYDMLPHTLTGPRIASLLTYVGARVGYDQPIKLRAIDGYVATPTLRELVQREYIAATHLDGTPLAIGGLGPLFVMYDVDRLADARAQPATDRYQNCVWGLVHIEV
ncbi:molybdopterin-dependent oxidoreductase [Ralstonia syzygii subsp. celebesensis]|uniref:Molybdopterin-dependent oxidoreductase n=3 Tax=Ralstonia solanacearum species complex TaxID=3116862 RepID=A0A1U9VHC7_9RALS|nr:hypothetical protein [Ralstonia syzygii]AQW30104.1 hypothetical protein B0B51_08980 [blood disease bacterium A2-HR MARDI]QQV56063.1 molybdopterin-dependent oxidoreductase [Ralstonia syzygii subsp. celebesensis]CCA80582.1 conserved exported hypothetical protein [blood disease bacterium R229]